MYVLTFQVRDVVRAVGAGVPLLLQQGLQLEHPLLGGALHAGHLVVLAVHVAVGLLQGAVALLQLTQRLLVLCARVRLTLQLLVQVVDLWAKARRVRNEGWEGSPLLVGASGVLQR